MLLLLSLVFAQVAQEWRDRYPQLHSTKRIAVKTYTRHVRVHPLPAFGERPITELP